MKVTHELTITAKCPANGAHDVYAVKVTTDRTIMVEEILGVVGEVTAKPILQEELTQRMADRLKVGVETVGYHSGVKTTVVSG